MVCDRGTTVADKITKVPIWVKLSNILDCYWTEDGLSSLASTIGRPICVDNLTSHLDIMPFARMCVEYKVGDALHDVIPAVALDASGNKYTVKVNVQYVTKPRVCTGCKNLGHLVSACPVTLRVWVKKVHSPVADNDKASGVQEKSKEVPVNTVKEVLSDAEKTDGWTQVKRKGGRLSSPPPSSQPFVEDSPTPLSISRI